jgi:hypothetical protein
MNHLLLLGLIILAGCGNNTGYVSVSGQVTLDGQPLANAIVTFQPMANSKGETAGVGSFGKTDAQGKFTLEAMTPSPQSGAAVGRHRVRIGTAGGAPLNTESDSAAPSKSKGERPRIPSDRIPSRYNTESTLTFDVPAGGTREAYFKLSLKVR